MKTGLRRIALAVGIVSAGDVKGANKAFRQMVPSCNNCHEDCAYMLAPAFPEFAD
tara:strand:- start:2354 stop:2518 length:165 start_codon:yes stop_codon:yes gene_type:complete